ncbi:MAG: hypothetical protein Q9201_000777 [Fulgogasparrea decipioides]
MVFYRYFALESISADVSNTKPSTSELGGLMPRDCPRYPTFGAAQGLASLYLGKGNNKSRQVEQMVEEMMALVVGAKPKCAAKDIYLHCEDGDHGARKREALEERATPSVDCDKQYPYKSQCSIIHPLPSQDAAIDENLREI